MPIDLVVAREIINLVFVSEKFMRFMVYLEAIFGLNCNSTTLAGHGDALFIKLQEIACHSTALWKVFAQSVPPCRPLEEMAEVSHEEASNTQAEYAEKLRTLFYLLIRKYRKVRQADFIKAIKRQKREQVDSLRRHLKCIQGIGRPPKASTSVVSSSSSSSSQPSQAAHIPSADEDDAYADDTDRDSESDDDSVNSSV